MGSFYQQFALFDNRVQEKLRDLVTLGVNAGMKKVLYFGAIFMFISWTAVSCESLSDCGICKSVQYEDNQVIYTGPDQEYCGDALIQKKATPPVTIGSVTTKVECR